MRKMSNKENPWHHPLFTALFKFILHVTLASSLLAATSVRPHFYRENLSPVERSLPTQATLGEPTFPTFPCKTCRTVCTRNYMLEVGSTCLASSWASLFHAAKSFRVTWSKRRCPACSPWIRELTERAWENPVQGLGKALQEDDRPREPRSPFLDSRIIVGSLS